MTDSLPTFVRWRTILTYLGLMCGSRSNISIQSVFFPFLTLLVGSQILANEIHVVECHLCRSQSCSLLTAKDHSVVDLRGKFPCQSGHWGLASRFHGVFFSASRLSYTDHLGRFPA